MNRFWQHKKYSGSFLEENSDNEVNQIVCKNCNSVGHTEGFCGTFYKRIQLTGYLEAQKVEFFSSQNYWQQGFPMSKRDNHWSIKSKFLQGKVEFKFKIDDQYWVVSEEYKNLKTKEGYINNYMHIVPGREEDYIVLDSKFSYKKDNLIQVKFQLNEFSVQEMSQSLQLKNDHLQNVQIMLWGDWNNWERGSLMKMQPQIKNTYKQWCCYLQLSPQKHFYKFQVNGQWVLDPYRESQLQNNFQNHTFEAKLEKEDLIDEIETQPEQNQIQKFAKIKKFVKDEMQTVDLWGHSLNVVNGHIYIIGGVGRNSYTNTIYKMNLKNYNMEFIDMEDQYGPNQLAFHKVIKYHQKLIVYGGQNEYAVSNEYHTFNCISKKWTRFKFKKNIPKREHFTATLKNNTCRVYFFGGYFFHPDAKEDKMFNDLYMLNLKIMDFQKIETENTPKARCHHSALMFGWNMVIFGGCYISNYQRQVFNDMYEINLSLEKQKFKWKKIETKGPCPEPRYGHLAVKHKQLMIMQGGKTSMNGIKEFYLSDLWIFNNIKRSWTEINLQNHKIKKAFHAGCFYEGKLIVFGGKFSNKFSLQEANTFYEIDLFSKEQNKQQMYKQKSFSMFNQ